MNSLKQNVEVEVLALQECSLTALQECSLTALQECSLTALQEFNYFSNTFFIIKWGSRVRY
jgi:hypothetical protein